VSKLRTIDAFETWAPTNVANRQRLVEHSLRSDHPVCRAVPTTTGQPPKGEDKEVGQIPHVYLGVVGCPIVLTKNQCVFFKLNNGGRGTVVAHLYAEGKKPPSLPEAVVCDFPDYDGPAWLQGEAAVGREKWIPIAVNFSRHKGDGGCKASRTGLPLRAGCAARANPR
jgi:hypothetical protein